MLITANVIAGLLLISSGAVYGYVRYRLGTIKTVAAANLARTVHTADSSGGLDPENILLIGNETRSGLTSQAEIDEYGSPQEFAGSLSDVIMVLHLNPRTRTASILSIPRDLFVPMPAGSPVGPYQKIDAALNDGANGADNLIQAIEDDLGIPINHYVELEFDGFQNTVNALGGINMYFPEKLYDSSSDLNIQQTGCIHLNGTEALALVRSRHLQYDPPGDNEPEVDWPQEAASDLARIVRDHTFLRILASAGESQGLTNPLKLNAFLGALTAQVVMDPGLKNQLLSLAVRYRHLNVGAAPETTIPITTGASNGYDYDGAAIGDVDFPVQPLDDQIISQWDGSALPTPAAPTSVVVSNLTSTPDLASNTAAALRAEGLNTSVSSSGSVPAPVTETLIQYPPNGLAQALDVARDLEGAVMFQLDPSLTEGTISVEVGSTVEVRSPASLSAPSTSVPATTSTTTPSTSTSNATGATSTTVPPTTTTTVPTVGGQAPSSSADLQEPWDPSPCPAN